MVTSIELWRRGEKGDQGARIILGIRILAGLVWSIFGFVFKVAGVLPRHREIIAHVLGSEIAPSVTVLIGLAETALGLWFLIGFLPRLCAGVQTAAILSMNTFELIHARSLLLAPVPMILLNAVFLALVWYAALHASPSHRDVSRHQI